MISRSCKIYKNSFFNAAMTFYSCLNLQNSDNLNNLNYLRDPEKLCNLIFNNIVSETKDFYLIDKPSGISLFRSTPTENLKYNGINSPVTIEDILPELRIKLKSRCDSLFISSELPWSFSGLCVLSKTKNHFEICKNFYKNSSLGKMPGYINQSYRCLCWNFPKMLHSPVQPFTFSYYQPDKLDYQYGISYRCDRPGRRKLGQRKYWTKHVGYDVVAKSDKENGKGVLVDVKSNSTYRGVIQLYLLEQGSIVIGEFIQASRLIFSGINNDIFILPPDKISHTKSLPVQLRQQLGEYNRNLFSIPLHIHCYHLLVPSSTIPTKKGHCFTQNTALNFNNESSIKITWDSKLKLNVCNYNNLPDYYCNIMKQLGVNRVPD